MFYCFNQNNSGGSFIVDEDVAHCVIIEADTAVEANNKAKEIGIYFDGVDKGWDCECCGDRWYSAWRDDADDAPVIYGTPVQEYKDSWAGKGEPYAHVYYADGRKETFRG